MRISGFQHFSINEYPGEISSIIFTQGCNFNCKYCFNPELVPIESYKKSYMDEDDVLGLLKDNKGKITAVTITGGEPLLQDDLMEFLYRVRDFGYKIKINTNGSLYMRLKYLIEFELVDFISMDIKAPIEKYEDITWCSVNIDSIKNSVKLIKKSGIPHVFHTVMDEDVLDKHDIRNIKAWIKDSKNYKVGEKK